VFLALPALFTPMIHENQQGLVGSFKSLQATRDGGFLRRPGYGGQASSAIAVHVIWPRVPELKR